MWGGGKKIGENNKKAAPQNHCAAPRGPIAPPLEAPLRRPPQGLSAVPPLKVPLRCPSRSLGKNFENKFSSLGGF